jgi:peroxisomal coenzyme A diphosphatase NUDT7
VRPCVAFLHADDVPGRPSSLVGDSMIPRLDAKEVAAVFSGPLHNFLSPNDEEEPETDKPLPAGRWYSGRWTEWHNYAWRVHNFQVPVHNQKVTRPTRREGGQAVLDEEGEEDTPQRFLVWGMTARIIVDAARVAYGQEPAFEHNDHFGDEMLIDMLEGQGQMKEKVKKSEVGLDAVKDDVKEAKM